ncbi:MAG: glycosyltransferase [Lachnospiraceae bacterium]|nr:glycosyltransferase [Lachnospiraceae bacterium]
MKKKILFAINTLGQAGAERALLNMVSAFDRNEYEIYLYVMLNQGELIDEVPSYVHILNSNISPKPVLGSEGQKEMIKTILFNSLRHFSGLRNLGGILSNYKKMKGCNRVQWDKLLWRTIATGARRFPIEFDLAIAYLEGGATYYVAHYIKAKKKVAWVHVDVNHAGYTKELDKDSYDKMDQIFTVSKEVRNAFLQLHPECEHKTDIFDNLLDVENIRFKSKEYVPFEVKDSGYRLLTVGRLHPQKSYDKAILAMKLVIKKRKDIKWYVVGDGPLREELNELIKENGLQDYFILVGSKRNPYPYYIACDIYVHATGFEGKSIAIEEAKVLGCPLIVSNVSGNREQVEDGVNGLICQLTPKDIAESILTLIEKEDLRKNMGRENLKYGYGNKEEGLEKIFELLKEDKN